MCPRPFWHFTPCNDTIVILFTSYAMVVMHQIKKEFYGLRFKLNDSQLYNIENIEYTYRRMYIVQFHIYEVQELEKFKKNNKYSLRMNCSNESY